jgi:hypothetical protein
MHWPWQRFESMFRLHLLRKAREELRQMRDMRLAAMDANTNYDSKENQQAKQQRTEELQTAYQRAVGMLYDVAPADQPDEFEADPLFAPISRSRRAEADQPLVEQAGMGRELMA